MDFGNKIYYFFPFSSFWECVCVCFCVRFCLYRFAFTICLRVLSIHFFYFSVCFFTLNFFSLFLIFFIFYFNNFIFCLTLFYFILFLFFLFFLPFILSHVDERLLVLQRGFRALPVRWESQLQDTGPQETSQLHVIKKRTKISQRSPSQHQDAVSLNHQQAIVWDTLCQTTSKTGTQPQPLAERLPNIIVRPQTPQNTP